jgi:hypothetical protein
MYGITLMSTQVGQGTQFPEINLAGEGDSEWWAIACYLKDGLPWSKVTWSGLVSKESFKMRTFILPLLATAAATQASG